MRNLMMVSVAAVSLLCTSSVMAEATTTKAAKAYDHGYSSNNGNPVSTITRTSNRMAEIIQRELKQVLRSAKRDFSEVKRVTRGNYQAEEAVYRLGESMGTADTLCKKLEQRLLPKLMEAARQLASQNGGHNGGGNNNGGYDNDYGNNHGGNNHHDNGGHSGHGNNISAMEVARLMNGEIAGRKKLRILENSVRYVRSFDGHSILDIVRQFISSSDKSRACAIIGQGSRVSMSSTRLCDVIHSIIVDDEKLLAAKSLVRGVSDLNPMTADRIARCFVSLRNQREFKRFALNNHNNY